MKSVAVVRQFLQEEGSMGDVLSQGLSSLVVATSRRTELSTENP
jgi:hypothetical protein